jgi:two-component system chemotaxis response regulator CheB
VLVVVHFPESAVSVLPRILNRAGTLPARAARDRDALLPGRIYVSTPGAHLLLEPGCVRVIRGPKENGHRPAIDPLFRSAATAYGNRVIGVVLSGNLDDGTAGLQQIKRRGGIAVVQDPDEALYPGMPTSAIANTAVDHVVPIDRMPALLAELARQPAEEESMTELDPPPGEKGAMRDNWLDDEKQPPSVYTCPECHGTLFEVRDTEAIPHYRCRVGHGFTTETLMVGQADVLEAALWTALRALEEHTSLARRMAARAIKGQTPQAPRRSPSRRWTRSITPQ